MDAVAIMGNVYFNAIRRVMRLSDERVKTVDSILGMIGQRKIIFISNEDRRAFLELTREMLAQLRLDAEIVADLQENIGETANLALEKMRKGGGGSTG